MWPPALLRPGRVGMSLPLATGEGGQGLPCAATAVGRRRRFWMYLNRLPKAGASFVPRALPDRLKAMSRRSPWLLLLAFPDEKELRCGWEKNQCRSVALMCGLLNDVRSGSPDSEGRGGLELPAAGAAATASLVETLGE